MINGDDLYNTYAEISRSTSPFSVWIFSKIYIYTFITLFIYVVLSLFIGIIGDTYERLKVCRIRTFALPSSCWNVTSGKIKRVVFILYLWFSQGRFENILSRDIKWSFGGLQFKQSPKRSRKRGFDRIRTQASQILVGRDYQLSKKSTR